MTGSHDESEITFYEELGVTSEASPEEIRDAFRLFVRLLHPDQQTDPQLKEIAEKQMRKLNRIYAVLSDPARRRRYDEIMGDDFSPPIILSSPSPGLRRMGRIAWAGAIVVSAGLLIWLASDNTPGVLSRSSDPNAALASAPASGPASPAKFNENAADNKESEPSKTLQLRSELRAVTVERDAAIQELNNLRGKSDNRTRQASPSGSSFTLDEAEPKTALTMTELPSTPKPPRIDRAANGRIAGLWFYAKPKDGQISKNQSLSPPEYVEATITEDGGVVHGRYRSRFQSVDRTIPPDVNFTFTGTPNGPQFHCLWTGAGGAKGELTLKLTSENSLRIDWTAVELGSLQRLSSGAAVLTRRIE